MAARVTWDGVVLAESDRLEVVEGSPRPSETHPVCGWKGAAGYLHAAAGGKLDRDSAWARPDAKEAGRRIARFVA